MDHHTQDSAPSNLLDVLLDVLADRLAERLAARAGTSTPRYADAKANPLGSARAFLDAGRAGRFPTFKRGREVVALWADVERSIESRKRPPRERKPVDPADEDRALLRAAGIRPRAERRAR
jgi:hypothetical protein